MTEVSEETLALAAYQDALRIREKILQSEGSEGIQESLREIEKKLSKTLAYFAGFEGKDPAIQSVRLATYVLLAESRSYQVPLETDKAARNTLIESTIITARAGLNLIPKEKSLKNQNFFRTHIADSLSNIITLAQPERKQEIYDLLVNSVAAFDATSTTIKNNRYEGISHYNMGIIWENEFSSIRDLNERAYFLEIARENFETSAECFLKDGNDDFLQRATDHLTAIEKQLDEIRRSPGYKEISEAAAKAKAKVPTLQPVKVSQPSPSLTPVKSAIEQCPVCGKEIRENLKFCVSCGTPVKVHQTSTDEKKEGYCSSCHAPIVSGKKFCGKCGAVVSSSIQSPQVQTGNNCPKCGAPFVPGKKFCGKCGGNLQ